jgi:non-homologous end joining protein Ku
MRELVERHTRTLKPADLASVERPRVRQLLDRKLAGEPIVTAALDEQADDVASTPPVELEAALKRSLKQAPRKRRAAARA